MATIITKEEQNSALVKEIEMKLAEIKVITEQKKRIEDALGDLKKEVQESLGESSYAGKRGKITYVKPKEGSTTIDISALQEKEPNLYDELLKDYPKKVSGRAASYRYTFA